MHCAGWRPLASSWKHPMREQRLYLTPRGTLVALVGNPNCGKTALFNLLTGSRQKVANYAGAKVRRRARGV